MVTVCTRLRKIFGCRNKGDEKEKPPDGRSECEVVPLYPRMWWKKCRNWSKRKTTWEMTKLLSAGCQGSGDLCFSSSRWWGLVPSVGTRNPQTVTKAEQEEEGRWIPPKGYGQGDKAF